MVRLLVVRHGESAANGKGFFAGQLDIPLSERGCLQAEKTAEWLFENYQVDKVYSSDLQRAFETGKRIAEKFGLKVEARKALREINAGEWQGKAFDELEKSYADGYSVWLKDIGRVQCPNGESVKDLYERIRTEVLRIVEENEGKTIVLAIHATPIRALCTFAMGRKIEEMKSVPWVSNASVTEIEVTDGTPSLRKFSVDEYLAGMQTSFPANV